MNTILRLLNLLTIVVTLLFFSSIAKSQVFSISEVKTDKFPVVKATFVAMDSKDNPYNNLTKSDFTITENSVNLTHTISVDCVIDTVEPEVSIVLVLDQSTSMNDPVYEGGPTRWEWVKKGTKTFINTIKFVDDTRIGIVTFGALAKIRCPFTQNRQELIDSITNTSVGGATFHNPPFLDYTAGAIQFLKTRPPDIRRIIVFLTDGDNRNKPANADSICKELNLANIQSYIITLGMPMIDSLEKVADCSGGKTYEVYTEEQLDNIYKLIALDIQTKQVCSLQWIAPFGCTENQRNRKAEITFTRPANPVPINRQYIAPANSIAFVEAPSIVSFGNPEPLNSSTQEIELIARHSPLQVTSINVLPAGFFTIENYGGNAPPFVLDSNQSRTITVKFTQGVQKEYRQASLLVNGSPCPPTIALVGGSTQVLLILPNGGEVFTTCEDIDIIWAGVSSTQKIDLSYSTDGGATWQIIAKNVTGLSYKWKAPKPGTQYKIKADIAEYSEFLWAKSFGSIKNELGASIAITKDYLYLYTTGSYDSSLVFSPEPELISRGNKDLYLTKFDTDGNVIWVRTAGGLGLDTSSAVCVDGNGNAFITGSCEQGIHIGNSNPTLSNANTPYLFLIKYPANGNSPSYGTPFLGATSEYTSFKAWGRKIRFDSSTGDIIIQGQYTGQYQYSSNIALPARTNKTNFIAVYGSDLNIKSLSIGTDYNPDFSSTKTADTSDNQYGIGTFTDPISFGDNQLNSKGGKDIYIYKYGILPASNDFSDKVFAIYAPEFELTQNTADCGYCKINQTNNVTFSGILKNSSDIPIEITKAVVTPNTNFDLGAPIESITILEGESIPIEISFQPKEVGPLSAVLEITGTCDTKISLNLTGIGICSGEYLPEYDFGKTNTNVPNEITIDCAFKNTNNDVVLVTPKIEDDPAPQEFFIISPTGGVLLEKDSCLKVILRFNPQVPGDRSANLVYYLPDYCDTLKTNLKGFGVSADIYLTDIDWNKRRILTSNDSAIEIKNKMVIPAKIVDITGPKTSFFEFTKPSLPLDIPVDFTQPFPVSFKPIDEIDYYDTIYFYIENVSEPFPVFLHGSGFLPKLQATFDCGSVVKPGATSAAKLNIYNPSKTSDLYISKIEFANDTNSEYSWTTGNTPSDFYVGMEDYKTIDVNFSPKVAGLRHVDIVFTSDARPGPNKNPLENDTLAIGCESLGITVNSPIAFGNVLLCDSRTLQLTIENKGGQEYLKITGYSFSGTNLDDTTAFTIPSSLSSLTIPPSGSRTVDIAFTPTEIKDYSITLNLINSYNEDLKTNLTGSGKSINLSSTILNIKDIPGKKISIPVHAQIDELANSKIENMTVTVKYDNKMLHYDDINFNQISNWTWSAPMTNSQHGELSIAGTGNLQTAFNDRLFTLDFTIYLSDKKESDVFVKPEFQPCITAEVKATNVSLSEFCFSDGRLIKTFNNSYYMMAPTPNPVTTNNSCLSYGIGLDKSVTIIELYDAMGNRIKYLVNKTLNYGNYNVDIPVSELSSGLYFIKMQSGQFVDSKEIIIYK